MSEAAMEKKIRRAVRFAPRYVTDALESVVQSVHDGLDYWVLRKESSAV